MAELVNGDGGLEMQFLSDVGFDVGRLPGDISAPGI